MHALARVPQALKGNTSTPLCQKHIYSSVLNNLGQHTRSIGFWSEFRTTLSRNVADNKDMQESMSTVKEKWGNANATRAKITAKVIEQVAKPVSKLKVPAPVVEKASNGTKVALDYVAGTLLKVVPKDEKRIKKQPVCVSQPDQEGNDTTTTPLANEHEKGLVIKHVGIWEKYATPGLDAARELSSKTVGRVFRSPVSAVLSKVKEVVPGFALHTFLEDMQDFAAAVLEAEFAGDALGLKGLATESYYRATVNTILARQAADQFTDCKLLDIGPVELLEARMIDRNNGQEVPVLHISFSVQQVYCIRNRAGKIKDGGEDTIKAGQYLMGVELVGNTWLCNGVAAQFMTDYQ